eukprot:2037153-Rhodomonas_salina.1
MSTQTRMEAHEYTTTVNTTTSTEGIMAGAHVGTVRGWRLQWRRHDAVGCEPDRAAPASAYARSVPDTA